MDSILNHVLSLPFLLRVALMLFLLFSVFWWILGKKILWVASFFLYLFIKGFHYIYLLIEFPISRLHKKFGAMFHKIDKSMSYLGGQIDTMLLKLYDTWHNPKNMHYGISILLYSFLVTYISIPSYLGLENPILLSGQKGYLYYENKLTDWLVLRGWYAKGEMVLKSEDLSSNLPLIVAGTNSILNIRDIPSINNCKVLTQVSDGDIVLWDGQLAFGDGDYGKIEPWVKVVTSNGVEGWTRLYFLHPEKDSDLRLKVTIPKH